MNKLLPKLIGLKFKLQYIFNKEKAVSEAFDLFCTPRKGKTKPYELQFLKTAIQQTVKLANHSVKLYEWKGTAGTVLLLHGWDSNSYRWKSLIEKLQEQNFHILTIDAPAHGLSNGKILNVPLYTECLKDLLELYPIDILVGHSIGAMTTIYFEKKYKCLDRIPIIALGPPSELYLFFHQFRKMLGLSKRFMKALEKQLHNRFGFYPKEFSIARFARELNADGLLVLEKNDPLAPYQFSKRIADKWKNCELITVEGVGHSLKHPDIDNKILNFIENQIKKYKTNKIDSEGLLQ